MSFFNGINLFEVNLGLVPGYAAFAIVGQSSAVDNVQYTDVTEFGGVTVLPTEAAGGETWEVLSSSANDTAAGTGARTINVISLDTSYAVQVTTATLNGVTPVVLSNTHFRPRAMVVTAPAGSLRQNDGDITVRVSGGGATRLKMNAGFGITQSSLYTVPAGKTSYFVAFKAWAPKGDDVRLRSRVTSYHISDPVELSVGAPFVYQNSTDYRIFDSIPLAEKTDLKIQAISTNVQADVALDATILEIDN